MPEFKHDVLIVGGDSRIGILLKDAMMQDGLDVATTTRRDIEWNDGSIYYLDLSRPNPPPLARVTYFCAAIARFKDCEDRPTQARWVNTHAPCELASAIHGEGGRVILLSSAAAETHPETVYGRTKLDAEACFSRMRYGACVRFGPVLFPGREVTPRYDRYEPILPKDLIWHLIHMRTEWLSGVHCILNGHKRILLKEESECSSAAMTSD